MLDILRPHSQRYLTLNNHPYQRAFLNEKCLKHRLSILLGQRGVGKTTLLVQYLLNQVGGDVTSTEILYVPVDSVITENIPLYEIAEAFVLSGGKWLVFDEIHHNSDWSRDLKSIYDAFPELHVLASGSSALEIHKGSHALSRRAIVSTLPGLSLREFLELEFSMDLPSFSFSGILKSHAKYAQEIVQLLADYQKKILPLFTQYLRMGFYPYFKDLGDEDLFFITLEQNLYTTINSDLSVVYPQLTGHSIRKIKQLMAFIAQKVPFVPNFHALKQTLDIGDTRTLKTYLLYLEDAGLVRLLMKASSKLNKVEQPEKVFLNNTSQLFALSAEAPNKGTVRELFFLTMLQQSHELGAPKNGDFLVDDKVTFEVGGKKKDTSQIEGLKEAFLAIDDIEAGSGKRIPLWLFGFLY